MLGGKGAGRFGRGLRYRGPSTSLRFAQDERVGRGGICAEDAVEDGVPGAALGVGAGCCAHADSICWMMQDVGDGGGELFVARDAAGHREGRRGLGGATLVTAGSRWRCCGLGGGAKDVGRASVGRDDGGDAAGEGFEDYVAEGVGVGGEDEEIHVGVGGGEGFVAEDAGHVGVGKGAAEGCFFGSVTDDVPVRGDAEGAELRVDFGEKRYIFFYGEAAYVAQDWLADFGVVERAGAARGGEEIGVDAALHEVAGAVDGAVEEGAEGGVGGVESLGAAIELRG